MNTYDWKHCQDSLLHSDCPATLRMLIAAMRERSNISKVDPMEYNDGAVNKVFAQMTTESITVRD